MGDRNFLEVEGLTRVFGDTAAVRDLSFAVGEHEIVTLLGPSGCGKTTTLRMIAGFEPPDEGRVVIDGREVTRLPPQRRGFGMVFQHYALFPHLDVGGNVAFGLEALGLPMAEVAERVARALELVRLPGTEDRAVGSLSGGQQQRVALARALAPEPKVLLLDEPLSNLDAALREQTRRELRALVKEIGITSVYVTHDQEEAFDLSDRIVLMRSGVLVQVGPAEELYHHPGTEFAATFLGRASTVLATAESRPEDGVVACRLAGSVAWRALAAAGTGIGSGAKLRLLARPEALQLTEPGAAGSLSGTVSERRFAGSVYAYTVTTGGGALEVYVDSGAGRVGQAVGVRPLDAPRGLHAFVTS